MKCALRHIEVGLIIIIIYHNCHRNVAIATLHVYIYANLSFFVFALQTLHYLRGLGNVNILYSKIIPVQVFSGYDYKE